MNARASWIWRAVTVVALAALLAAARPSPLIGAQEVDPARIALVQSDQFGYVFWYDTGKWSITQEGSEPGAERFRLTHGQVFVDYLAFLAPGTSPRDCLDVVLEAIVAEPGIVAIEALAADGGQPTVVAARDGWVSTDLVVTIDGDAGRSRLVTREACGEIAPGGALLYKSVNVPAAVFNGMGGFFSGVDPEVASSFPVVERFDLRSGPVPIPGWTGSPTGALSTSVTCGATTFRVVAQNTARGGNFVVDPNRFVALYAADDRRPGYAGSLAGSGFVEWLSPSLSAEDSLALGSGEVGLFNVAVPEIGLDLYYVPELGDPVLLGSNPGGCGAGGAAPITIDME